MSAPRCVTFALVSLPLAACASSEATAPLGTRMSVPEGEILSYDPIERAVPVVRPSTPPAAGRATEVAPRDGASDAPLAEIGGEPIPLSALHDYLLRHNWAECSAAADALVEADLVRREAERLEVPPVDAATIDTAVDRAVAGLARRLAPESPNDLAALESHLGGLGKSLESYRAELREAAERRLRLARLARFEEMTSDSMTLQEAVFTQREAAETALADLAMGADFSRLAASRSSAPSASEGGRLPAAPLSDLDPAVRDAVMPLGERAMTGIVAVRTPAGARFAIYRVLERRPGLESEGEAARERAWSAVEQSLMDRPVGDDEILRWTRRNHKRYDVRVNLGPR